MSQPNALRELNTEAVKANQKNKYFDALMIKKEKVDSVLRTITIGAMNSMWQIVAEEDP